MLIKNEGCQDRFRGSKRPRLTTDRSAPRQSKLTFFAPVSLAKSFALRVEKASSKVYPEGWGT